MWKKRTQRDTAVTSQCSVAGWEEGSGRVPPPTLELFAGAGASWPCHMAHSGRPRGPQSPGPFRSRRDRLGAPRSGHLPYGAEEEEEWETDPDFTHEASRPWREREISTSSIISGRQGHPCQVPLVFRHPLAFI